MSSLTVTRDILIAPPGGMRGIDLAELWAYRSLVLTLTVRHIQVRYAQSVLGVGWTLLQPLASMAVFTVIFSRFAHLPSDGQAYPVFALAAIVPWAYFASALSGAGGSLSATSALLTKVYFPRLALPLSHVLASLVDFAIGLLLLVATLAWFGVTPSWSAVAVVPMLIVAMMLLALGVGSLLAAIDVQFRDVRHVVPFLLQLWLYASPIVYPLSMVPASYRPWYDLNPMAGIITAFRAVLLGTPAIDWGGVAMSLLLSAGVCAAGILVFRRRERVFADVV